jgi:predicted Zn-dependent protease
VAILKFFITLLLILLLLIITSSIALLFLVKFENKTPLGLKVKNLITRYPAIVNLINLNQPGDFKYLYFGNNVNVITINAYYNKSNEPDSEIQNWLTEIVKATTNKSIYFKLNILSNSYLQESYSDTALQQISTEINKTNKSGPYLNVVYLNSYEQSPGSVGVVVNKDTIFIFKQTLNKLSDNSEVLAALEKSTIMHEWGHLLGLDHNNGTDCIMNIRIEVYDRQPIGHQVATNYCDQEIKYFDSMKLNLK